jgi:hypothetical protein
MFGFVSSKLLQETISGLTYPQFEDTSCVNVQTRIRAYIRSSYSRDITFKNNIDFYGMWNSSI